MDQPNSTLDGSDIERIVLRDFPAERKSEVMAILEEYGRQNWHWEPQRTRLAALKLATGNLERLRSAIETAKSDYRDLLIGAEWPFSFKHFGTDDISAEEVQQDINKDRQQYKDWLTSTTPQKGED